MKIVFLTVLHFCACTAAWAAEFRLQDGSVVFGSIVELSDGSDLVVDTEHMDKVVIEWSAVAQILNTDLVSVELFDGRRLVGTMLRDGKRVEISGPESVQVRASDVFWIEEYSESFLDGFSADTDVGTNIVRGNNKVTQISVGAGVGFDGQNFETSLRANTIINDQADSEDTLRSTLTGSYTRKFSDSWQALASLQFESDEQQGLDSRTLLTGAIGKRVYNRRKHRLELFAGVAMNAERFSGLPTNESLEGLFGTRYRMRSFADVDATLAVLPNLEDGDRVRVQFDASINFDLYADLDFKLTLYDRYDSEPPAGNDNNDVGVTLGLGWSY